MSTTFYQCSYCKIYFNHEGEERKEAPMYFSGNHGACFGCRTKWVDDLKKLLELSSSMFGQPLSEANQHSLNANQKEI